MGVESFFPEVWAGALQSRLHNSLILANLCNRDYQGDVEFGDRVRINKINARSASDYTPNSTTITYTALDGAPIFLDINRRKYSEFYLEDLDKRQAKGDVMGEGTSELSYALSDEMDTYIGTLYDQAQIVSGLGTSGTPIDITSLNVTEYLGLVDQKMDEANVPSDRWFACQPWFYNKIQLADITLNTDNTDTIKNGFKGRYLGFDIYVSNNISEGTASTHADSRCMAGFNGSITLAQQLASVEAMRAEGGFRDLVRALNVYGSKVVRPNALACLRADYTDEP